jgi:hypothetical protein
MSGAQRWLWTAAVLSAACSGDGVTEPANRAVASVVITPASPQLIEGEEITLSARALDASGAELTGRTISWTSSDLTVATVSTAGVVKALKDGGVEVTAATGGKSAKVAITVDPIPVASVELDVENVAIAEGATQQLAATVKSATGQTLTGRYVGWTSSDPSIVYVDPLGKLTAVRVGAATITATVHGKTDAAQVIVSADYDYDLVYSGWSGVAGVAPELWRVNMNHPGGMPARMFPGKPVFEASPSPDGTRIAFATYFEGRPQIYVTNIDGSGVKRLTEGPEWNDQPAWSPDGSRIAFRKWALEAENGQSDIWLIDPDGANAVNLTTDLPTTNQTSPTWSPSTGGGYRIAFSSQTNDPNGEAHLFTMAADGSDKQQITFGAVFDDQPAWSPEGTTIAFERYSASISGDLFLVDATGGNEKRLSPAGLAFGQFGPAWSPDGKLVAFTSKHADGNTYQVYTVWADGTRLAQRTFDDYSKSRAEFIVRQP